MNVGLHHYLAVSMILFCLGLLGVILRRNLLVIYMSLALMFIHANGFHVNVETTVNWLSIGGLNVDFGLKLDALSLMMLLVVTGVGGAIHIYSYGYMRDDRSFSRFFACMSLFTFSMLGI